MALVGRKSTTIHTKNYPVQLPFYRVESSSKLDRLGISTTTQATVVIKQCLGYYDHKQSLSSGSFVCTRPLIENKGSGVASRACAIGLRIFAAGLHRMN